VWVKEAEVKVDENPVRFVARDDSGIIERNVKDHVPGYGTLELAEIRLNRDGCLVEYRAETHRLTEDAVTKVSRRAQFKEATPLTNLKSPPPYWVGSLKYPSTAAFIRDNLDRVRLVGQTVIDSAETFILEWDVPTEDAGKAFCAMSDTLSKNGGVPRLYAAPTLGFALPRIEYVSVLGEVQRSIRCFDFREVTEGIFFPQTVQDSTADIVFSYSIQNIQTVDETASHEKIDCLLPAGTMILGAREIDLSGVKLDHATAARELTKKMKAAKASGG